MVKSLRTVALTMVSATLLSLTACSDPLFVPEAGPFAPGYHKVKVTPPPAVELVHEPGFKRLEDNGSIDLVESKDGRITINGWAPLPTKDPRGLLQVVLPDEVTAELIEVAPIQRDDVAEMAKDKQLTWAGFSIILSGELPAKAGVCVISSSSYGDFRISGSESTLCP